MIKIKLSDPNSMKCFSGFIHAKDLLKEFSIDITITDDYKFIDASQFVNLAMTLDESVKWGIDQISKKTGDILLIMVHLVHRKIKGVLIS